VKTQRDRYVAWLVLMSFALLCLPTRGAHAGPGRYNTSYTLKGTSSTDIAKQVLLPFAIIYLVAVYPKERAKAKAAREKAAQEQREIAGVAKTLEDPDPAVADAGIQMLAKYGQKAAPAAESLLANKDPKVRSRAVTVLAIVGGPASVSPLAKALQDSEASIRLAAIEALTAKPEPASAKVLTEALANSDALVRAQAATGLGVLREKRAIKPLEKLLTTEMDEVVRKAAQDALHAINSPAPPKPVPTSQPAG
jgi:HEAT repeat protein